jgi:hypothetical protein
MASYQRGLCALLLSLSLFLSAGELLGAEFSARVVTNFHGQESQGKVYVKGKRIRQEFASGASARVVIYNADTQEAWMLMPERKMYLEVPITEEMIRDLMQVARDQTGIKPLGSETVNGYVADKYETLLRTNGGEVQHYIWIARQLGMIIKIVSLDQSFSREYRDIREGDVADGLLAPPPDYQKMSLTGGDRLRK